MRTAGLFDLQVNGFAGVDFNDAGITPDTLDHALAAMLKTGVTTCLPTVITATREQLAARFAALDRAVAESRLGPRMVPGYHLEGPFLSPRDGYAGCHPPSAMIAADPDLVTGIERDLRRKILMITVAPEIANAIPFIRWAAGPGRIVALGHTAATAEDVRAAADAGATLSTHLGNGVAHQQHKFDNPIFAQLAEDRLQAGFIADGIHVPPDALKVMLRAKAMTRSILVTDAVTAAAAPPGPYGFAGMPIVRAKDGSVRVPGGTYLAGSALTLDQAVRNIVAWGIAGFPDAIAMASQHPRALMRKAFDHRGIKLPAGTVTWTPELAVAKTDFT